MELTDVIWRSLLILEKINALMVMEAPLPPPLMQLAYLLWHFRLGGTVMSSESSY
jgi:hypothetical protein